MKFQNRALLVNSQGWGQGIGLAQTSPWPHQVTVQQELPRWTGEKTALELHPSQAASPALKATDPLVQTSTWERRGRAGVWWGQEEGRVVQSSEPTSTRDSLKQPLRPLGSGYCLSPPELTLKCKPHCEIVRVGPAWAFKHGLGWGRRCVPVD